MRRTLPLLALPVVLWGCGTDVDGPVAPLLDCVYGDVTTLDPSEVRQRTGVRSQTLCVGPDGVEPGVFLYIPFFASSPPEGDEAAGALTLDVEVAGIRTEGSALASAVESSLQDPAPSWRGGGPGATGDPVFHDWLRRREIAELGPRIRAGGGSGVAEGSVAASQVLPDVPTPGDRLELNVAISCTESDMRTGRVVHVSEHAIVVTDSANPATLFAADYEHIAATFDTLVHPMAASHFGPIGDIDGNGRTLLFFTRAVNERTTAGSGSMTLGFFWSGDLFPTESTPRLEACPAANQAEILYLIAPDPNGVVGPALSADRLKDLIIPLIGHEIQHLANASRRLYVNDATALEDPWLNEGLSHMAEELLFYRTTGLDPGTNLSGEAVASVPDGLALLHRYMWGNLNNFRRYLGDPTKTSPMGADGLATRGAIWSFLRYAADRSLRGDQAFMYDLVNGRTTGLDNLDRVIDDRAALQWMHDWTVSLYADDLLPGVPARFTMPSWNFHALFPAIGMDDSPLFPIPLATSGPSRVELLPGGTAFTAFSVPAGAHAVLHVTVDDPSKKAAVRGSIVRVH